MDNGGPVAGRPPRVYGARRLSHVAEDDKDITVKVSPFGDSEVEARTYIAAPKRAQGPS